jgi:hypothetical protein
MTVVKETEANHAFRVPVNQVLPDVIGAESISISAQNK